MVVGLLLEKRLDRSGVSRLLCGPVEVGEGISRLIVVFSRDTESSNSPRLALYSGNHKDF